MISTPYSTNQVFRIIINLVLVLASPRLPLCKYIVVCILAVSQISLAQIEFTCGGDAVDGIVGRSVTDDGADAGDGPRP